MAIAYVNSGTQSSSGNPSSPVAFAYSVNASTKTLVLGIQTNNNTTAGDQVTGVTYNGVSMVKEKDVLFDAYGHLYIYVLHNPATGSNNFSISFNNAGDVGFNFGFVMGEYSGTSSASPPDSSATGSASASSLTTTTTTVADNAWLVEIGAALVATTAGSSTTKRQQIGPGGPSLFDSNADKTPAGSHSLIFTRSGSGNLKAVLISFAPGTAATGHTKNLLTLGIG